MKRSDAESVPDRASVHTRNASEQFLHRNRTLIPVHTVPEQLVKRSNNLSGTVTLGLALLSHAFHVHLKINENFLWRTILELALLSHVVHVHIKVSGVVCIHSAQART